MERRRIAAKAAWRGGFVAALAAALVGSAARAQEAGGTPAAAPADSATVSSTAGAATPVATAVTAWHDAAALERTLEELTAGHRELARVTTYGKSRAGRPLWCVELGMIDHPQRDRLPALLVVAGLDGHHLVGTEVVLDHARRLLAGYGNDAAITKLLDEHLVYLLPRANPDGAEAAFAAVKRELRGNLHPTDEDRDGALDEDAPEDLNGDGFITQMRWKDPAGTLIEDPADARLLRAADPLKGERGVWKVGVEGIDRDGDGECGEDGFGDVVPNRNFPQRWQEFDPAAGRVPMDEPESLALGQFLFERPAIALAIVYGVHDNLAVDAKGDGGGDAPSGAGPGGGGGGFRGNRTMPSGLLRDDLAFHTELATRYRATTGVTSKPLLEADDGAFVPFCYFQFGVPTLAIHLWSPPLDVKAPEPAKADTAKPDAAKSDAAKPDSGKPEATTAEGSGAPAGEAASGGAGGGAGAGAGAGAPAASGAAEGGGRRGRGGGGPGGGGPGGGGPGGGSKNDGDELKQLLWNDHAMGGSAFVPWTKVRHPTLGEVEVGGFKPYVRSNPPLAEVGELARKHSDHLAALGGLFAQLRVADVKVENLGGALFRVTATIVNDGWLPTVTSMGERNRRPRPARLDLDLGGAKLLQGQARATWQRIEGYGRREVKWLLQAEAGTEVQLRLWSEKAGDDERVVELK